MDLPLDLQDEPNLPECKIKRNYSCPRCSYFTQNPRFYLSHLRDEHGERININNCNLCLYASRHYQKLVRHMKMVHGSTAEGIPSGGQARKRLIVPVEDMTDTFALPPLSTPSDWIVNIDNLSYDLKSSRKTLKDIAAIYFAENEIDDIMARMEASDVVEVVPPKEFNSGAGDIKSVGSTDLDIMCPNCGYVSRSFLDSMIHGKSCTFLKLQDIQCEPLDLSMKKSPDSALKKDQDVSIADDLIKELIMKCENIFKNSTNSNVLRNKLEEDKRTCSWGEVNEKAPVHGNEQRKVFKCPDCPFLALTASRFHIHIVGHQNKKPFKCSLCVYCSNWRWDITKHIRLRTLRSPSHRNARVLMQNVEIGGRYDYRKYDKYITLCDTFQQDSVSESKNYEHSTLNNKEISTVGIIEERKEIINKNDSNSSPIQAKLEEMEVSSVNDNKPKGQFKEVSPRSFLVFENGEKPTYKCSKCSFRHRNRDAVLVHVKIHHQDLLKISTSLPNEEKPRYSNIQKVEEIKTPVGDNTLTTDIDVELIEVDVEKSVDTPSRAKDLPKKVEDNSLEKDKALSSNSGDNNDNDMKTVPSFRCWHCHQLSNWKHVIQRHCRLKHSGSVRIEFIDQSAKTKSPTYHLLNFSSTSSTVDSDIQSDTSTKNVYNEIKMNEDTGSSIEVKNEVSRNEKDELFSLKDNKNTPIKVKQVKKSESDEQNCRKRKSKKINENTEKPCDINMSHATAKTVKITKESVVIPEKTELLELEQQETKNIVPDTRNPTEINAFNSAVDAKTEKTDKFQSCSKDSKIQKGPSNNVKKLSSPPPAASPRKTIFVNPRTGRIVKKN